MAGMQQIFLLYFEVWTKLRVDRNLLVLGALCSFKAEAQDKPLLWNIAINRLRLQLTTTYKPKKTKDATQNDWLKLLKES